MDREATGRRVAAVELLEAASLGRDGFFRLKRCRVQNLRHDGSRSVPYALEIVERPLGLDAVVVLPYAKDPARVLLRRGLRPVLRLGRAGTQRDGAEPPLCLIEAVAGILERGDVGPAGLRERAAVELAEEVGLSVAPGAIGLLGGPMYVSSGVIAEQIFFCAVQTTLRPQTLAAGDGSPMEEGGEAIVMELSEALASCDDGRICDLKTECAIRRLAGALGC